MRTLVPKVIGQTTGVLQKKQAGSRSTSKWVEMQFQHMKGLYEDKAARAGLLRQLSGISGIEFDANRVSARPSFPVSAPTNPEYMVRFLEVWETDVPGRN